MFGQKRGALPPANDDQEVVAVKERRDAALDTLTGRTISSTLLNALGQRVEEMQQQYEQLQADRQAVALGLEVLDDQARATRAMLGDRALVPARWQEPEPHLALKCALHLLVHKATLVQAAPGAYVVELRVYALERLVRSGRETATHESTLVLKRTTTIVARR